MNLHNKRVCVTGGAGFLGSRIVEELKREGAIVFVPRSVDYDLRKVPDTRLMLLKSKPEIVIHAAANAGGIKLNQEKPADLFFDNMSMGLNVMDQSLKMGFVKKFVQIGTICSYPKWTPVPFEEINLWSGYPEDTNAPYGIAKKALLAMGQAYRKQHDFNVIHLLPVNLYGPNDNFNPFSSHVVPALIHKFTEAVSQGSNEVMIWGDGTATREFLYVDDCASAIVMATQRYDGADPINIGIGSEIQIKHLATRIANIVGYKGAITYDVLKPNGQPRRCLDTTRAFEEFGFKATTTLNEGLQKTIDWYRRIL